MTMYRLSSLCLFVIRGGTGPLSQRSAMSKVFYRKGPSEEKFGAYSTQGSWRVREILESA